MAEQWQVDGPRIIDVGSDQERIESLVVALIGGHVGVVTHSDSPSARVEVTSVEGLPLRVSWDGHVLKVMHDKQSAGSLFDALRRLIDQPGDQRAEVSISVPASVRVSVSTVSAGVVASGLRRGLTANTVSGELTVSDIEGTTKLNTVSGAAECAGLRGEAKLNTVSGSITVQDSDIRAAKLNTVSGGIALDLRNGRADVSSNSVSGDVTVRAPYTGYAVSASSATSQVVIDGQSFGRAERAAWGDGRSHGWAGGSAATLRQGDESLRIKANSV